MHLKTSYFESRHTSYGNFLSKGCLSVTTRKINFQIRGSSYLESSKSALFLSLTAENLHLSMDLTISKLKLKHDHQK